MKWWLIVALIAAVLFAAHIASKRQDLNTENRIARKPINAESFEADGMKARAVSGQHGSAIRESAEVP